MQRTVVALALAAAVRAFAPPRLVATAPAKAVLQPLRSATAEAETFEFTAETDRVMEIIINGRDLNSLQVATQQAIDAAIDTPGLLRISAGNYGGRLGKSFIYLRPQTAELSSV